MRKKFFIAVLLMAMSMFLFLFWFIIPEICVVFGDMDLPVSTIIEAEGHKIGVIHGEVYPRGDTQQLYYHALQLGADILVSGHSHVAQLEKIKNVILVNPGSPTNPRLSDPSVALMEINGNEISIEFIQTGKPVCSSLNFFEEKGKKDKDR